MKQKLAMAIALLKDAPILIFDEPTLGLDIESQHHVKKLLSADEMSERSLMITTHDIPFAHAVDTRFIILSRGKVVWEGGKQALPSAATLESLYLSVI